MNATNAIGFVICVAIVVGGFKWFADTVNSMNKPSDAVKVEERTLQDGTKCRILTFRSHVTISCEAPRS